ncbi:copper resistance protein CopC [Corynebacterium poyangense]|uniref:Copper resistance protein CopC n=1 Tax=Corynebacterium poyangense TaxID=2684405 RepID=A0A7H0SP68_9CORY|nr:copper resistance CopC family protein [Corynebacterium poyangense]MBZ8177912.1 copper resistance protein CopC [Corynebacterium poyangense]QNQ90343.1 copper resistance protein CopC [Corynebacterium poyangense]
MGVHQTRAGVAAAVLGIAVLGHVSPIAAAHDVVTEAQPPQGGMVQEFPQEIQLTFSGEPKPNFNMFAVSNTETGEILFSGQPELHGRLLSIKTPQDVHPGPGTYTVGFQITSSDGHSTRGSTEFTVGAPGDSAKDETADSAEQGTTNASHDNSSSNLLTWIAAGVGGLAVVGVVVVSIMRRRHTKN